jgi:hypothetical protein
MTSNQHRMCFNLYSLFNKPECRVLVAGAKANPIFPIESPDVFIGAHAGIYHANRFDASTFKIGIVTNWFLCKEALYCDTVREFIKNVKLDHLIVIESIRQEYENILPSDLINIPTSAITRLSVWNCTLLELSYLGFNYLSSLLSSLPPRKIIGFILQLLTEKTSYLTRLSTGMFSALYIYNLLPKSSLLAISGIGLQLGGSYFFDRSNKMQKAGHYSQDIYIAAKLLRHSQSSTKRVIFTDPDAQKALLDLETTSMSSIVQKYLQSITKY